MSKTPEKFLALDLEFNKPSGRIIQVGVAVAHVLQSAEEYLVRGWLTDPGEPINPEITALTGITDHDIQEHAVPWPQVVAELSELLSDRELFGNPVVWGVGDAERLKATIQEQGLEFPFMGYRSLDVKTLHVADRLFHGKSFKGGLSAAMQQRGMKFIGKPHRAPEDAYNTLRLFFRFRDMSQSVQAIQQLAAQV